MFIACNVKQESELVERSMWRSARANTPDCDRATSAQSETWKSPPRWPWDPHPCCAQFHDGQ